MTHILMIVMPDIRYTGSVISMDLLVLEGEV
jgi:hypothetical protein